MSKVKRSFPSGYTRCLRPDGLLLRLCVSKHLSFFLPSLFCFLFRHTLPAFFLLLRDVV